MNYLRIHDILQYLTIPTACFLEEKPDPTVDGLQGSKTTWFLLGRAIRNHPDYGWFIGTLVDK